LPLVKAVAFASKRRVPDWAVVILLGVIEGITEFLPISSTGHLLLAEHGLHDLFGIEQQSDLFNVVIQGGAVLAVVLLFTKRLRQLIFHWREPESRGYLVKLGAAFLLTAAGGLVLKALDMKLPKESAPVAWATLIGGVLFIGLEAWLKDRPRVETVTWTMALAVGAGQLLAAVFPGLSRSGSTILMALALGLSRPAATEFSFLLGIPTLLSAGGLEIVNHLRHPAPEALNVGLLALGSVVAAVTAFVSVKWLLRFVQAHTFVGFGWYRIVVGALILWLTH
jgi:undecaprenyl-diphosphatase